MSFDTKAFTRAKYVPRTKKISISSLKEFFADGDINEFVIRGLDIVEFVKTTEANKRNNNIDSVVRAFTIDREKVEAIKELLGVVSDDVPKEVSSRLETLVYGCIDPRFDLQQARIFADRFPVDFWYITQEIMILTGLGMDLKKSSPSG